MKRFVATQLVALAISAGLACTTMAAPIISVTPTLSGGSVADFEGFADGTFITNQYAGVVFGQLPSGRPMIDNQPFLFAYHQSSGVGVLTGSTEGGYPFPTVAPLTMSFGSLQSAVEMFFSDDSPLGSYTVEALDAANNVLESFVLSSVTGGPINLYIGFTRGSADIAQIQVGLNKVFNDAFAIDDVRYNVGIKVPEPATLALLGIALAAAGLSRRRAK